MARQRATTPKSTKTKAPAKTSRSTTKTAKAKTAGAGAVKPSPAPLSAGGETRTKFTLYNLLGKERAYYLVDRADLERPSQKVSEKSVAHSIVIIDRSGSMGRDLKALKEILVKLFTLDENSRTNLLLTLLSYASQGDLTVHFQRVAIQDVMKAGSAPLPEPQ